MANSVRIMAYTSSVGNNMCTLVHHFLQIALFQFPSHIFDVSLYVM